MEIHYHKDGMDYVHLAAEQDGKTVYCELPLQSLFELLGIRPLTKAEIIEWRSVFALMEANFAAAKMLGASVDQMRRNAIMGLIVSTTIFTLGQKQDPTPLPTDLIQRFVEYFVATCDKEKVARVVQMGVPAQGGVS